jgi:prepilin-type N-terminal cleavage/methylation domain-containing protein
MTTYGVKKFRSKGFTLVESILAIVVISALAVALVNILITALDSYGLIVDRREALQRARLAANMMAGELQVIEDPATDITAISPSSITFDSVVGSVTYAIAGNTLTRTDGSGTSTLADDLTGGSGFQYYTAGGATTTNPAQVYRIGFVIGVDTGTPEYGTVVINSDVYLRNRYYDSFTQI